MRVLDRLTVVFGVAGLWLGLFGVAISASASGSQAGTDPAHASIIGGHGASIAEFPSLAFLEGEDAVSGFSCTGTVVAPRVILTAGHCVEDIEAGAITPASSYAVATGVANLAQVNRANISAVSEAVVFPGFNPSKLQGDAGLLILTAPVAAPALPLASSSDSALLKAGTPLSIAGWGVTNAKAKEPPAQLQAGSTVIQSPEYCRRQSSRYYPFYSSARQFCAVDTPSHVVSGCFGDSGGPAIAQRSDGSAVEVGVVSSGGPGCSRALPNVFTRVDQVSSWVASWIASVEAGAPAPEITIPKAHSPFLTFSHAEDLSAVVLNDDFRYRFRNGVRKRIRCLRIDKERVRCGVGWSQGGNDYFGTITIYYAIERNSVIWADHYKIHWVNDRCWFHSGHRQTCVIRTRAR